MEINNKYDSEHIDNRNFIIKWHRYWHDIYKYGTILKRGEKMLKTYLMENYGYNEPIFLNKNSFKEIPSNLKEEFLNMCEENNKNLENIPEKYRKLEVINEELNKLSME